MSKRILLVENDEEKFKVARILNGLCGKIDNKKTIFMQMPSLLAVLVPFCLFRF